MVVGEVTWGKAGMWILWESKTLQVWVARDDNLTGRNEGTQAQEVDLFKNQIVCNIETVVVK